MTDTTPAAPELEHEHDDEPVRDVSPPSILEQLRERREAMAHEEAAELVLTIPRYEGKLAVRFRYPEGGYKTIVSAIERAQASQDPDAILYGNCDALIACCAGIIGLEDGKHTELDPSDPRPLTFGPRLAALFGLTIPEGLKGGAVARYVVRHVFSPAASTTGIFDGDVALIATAGQVVMWLQSATERTGEAFAGES
jgi:hypothetical protein